MPWPFELEFMQRALLAALAVGIAAPLVGTFLVQRRMALFGDGIGHAAFAGVGAGLLLDVWPVWSALAVAVAGALVVEWLRAHGRATSDLALALFFYSGLAAGSVLLARAGSEAASRDRYLFGSVLTTGWSDVRTVVALAAVIVALVSLAGRALFAVVLDEESARVNGLPVDRLNLLLAGITAVTVVAAIDVVGTLLVAALMVLPVATSRLLARSFRATLLIAVAVGVTSALGGLTASRAWDLAPGGTIVLVAAAGFALAAVVRGVTITPPEHMHQH
jgi:zinc transport system permease protein